MMNGAAVDMDVVAVVGRHTHHQQKQSECGQRWQQLKQIAKVDTNVLKQETYIEELLLYALFSVSQKVVLKDLKAK